MAAMDGQQLNGRELTAEEELEKDHFQRIVYAFSQYRTHALHKISTTEKYIRSQPSRHRKLLKNYCENLKEVRKAVDDNNEIVKLILHHSNNLFEESYQHLEFNRLPHRATQSDMEKVQTTLKQFVRDWTLEGAEERRTSYEPIINEIELRFPASLFTLSEVKILVPGAGLGRLANEIARRGYSCQGNEFSLFMLLASNFVLNQCPGSFIHKLYPWVHQACNTLRTGDQTKSVLFPDVDPTAIPPGAQFSMVAGDFLEVYRDPECWDCVATCFFIDTAANICNYIESIYTILKKGGIWINLGPLLYHFADTPGENSLEPSYEHVRELISGFGFQFLHENDNVRTTYSQNPHSMLKYEYRSVYFVCRKPSEEEFCFGPEGDTNDIPDPEVKMESNEDSR